MKRNLNKAAQNRADEAYSSTRVSENTDASGTETQSTDKVKARGFLKTTIIVVMTLFLVGAGTYCGVKYAKFDGVGTDMQGSNHVYKENIGDSNWENGSGTNSGSSSGASTDSESSEEDSVADHDPNRGDRPDPDAPILASVSAATGYDLVLR